MNTETLSGLQLCPLFAGISDDEIIDMMHRVVYRVVNYRSGDVVVHAGTPCTHADIVLSGDVVASLIGPSGRVIRISMHHSGNMLAPAFLFAGDNNYPVTVTARTDTQIFRLKDKDMVHLIKTEPRVAENYIKIVSNIVSFLTKKVGMLSLNVREKIALFLREESQLQKSNRVHINMTRQELADNFGIQKYSLQRCLKDMQKDGEIKVDGRYITLLK